MTFSSGSDKPPQGIIRSRVVLGLIGLPVFFALLMFLPAGTWAWPKGWLFISSEGRHHKESRQSGSSKDFSRLSGLS